MTSPYRPEFEAALRLLAEVSEALVARGLPRPILVGGGAVEYYSGSAIMTGDLDLTFGAQEALEEELQRKGFVRPSGPGKLTRGWVHPELGLSFEVVGSTPLDGAADPRRTLRIDFADNSFAVIAIEDLIADRMGQYASGSAPEMLTQARELLALQPDVDRDYLDRRIRYETAGDHGLEDLED